MTSEALRDHGQGVRKDWRARQAVCSPSRPGDAGPHTQQARGTACAPTQLRKSAPTEGPAASLRSCGFYVSSLPGEKGQSIIFTSCHEAVVETQCLVLLELKEQVEISCGIKSRGLVLRRHMGNAGCSQFVGPGSLFEVMRRSGTRQS